MLFVVIFVFQLWDIGGQPRFRSMWERYCRGVSAIVWVYDPKAPSWSHVTVTDLLCRRRYMVDAADPEKIEASKNELHNLLDKPQLQGIPVSRRTDSGHVLWMFWSLGAHERVRLPAGSGFGQ